MGLFSYRALDRLPNQIVYFVKNENEQFSLKAVARNSDSKILKDKLIDAVGFLIEGPRASEKGQGLVSHFPSGIKMLGLKIIADEVSVDFSNEFLYLQNPSASQGLIYQVFYTLSQPKSINKVRILVEGSPLNYLGGEVIIVEQPWTKISNDLPKW